MTEPAQQAQDTIKLKEKVASETEAETLERVKEALQGPGGTRGQGGTTGPTGTAGPGAQTPSPIPPLPEPKHGKARPKSGK